MDYNKWSQEYEEEALLIQRRIALLREELKAAADARQTNDLNGRIYMLYGMYLECRHTAEILRRYARAAQKRKDGTGW